MKRKLQLLNLFVLVGFLISQGQLFGQKKFQYESFPNDPYKTRIYTLDNGLKVYLSPFDEEPRIQTYVAVRVGSMHDPAETTGLAHYFEHLMFKGTSNFGTLNWEKEKPLLDKIEQLFEVYRLETDQKKRTELYRQIDSISYLASTFAIPNEYQRLMSSIGSTGTNAFTSNDFTAYIENIPSNQLDHWALVQSERFSNPVLRLFHTELETVYEEKNMSMTNDGRQANEALMQGLFPVHPYGTQTTLGDAEHLKNPSLINIRNFYEQYYVPNNMAVIMSGDFDPDQAIKVIDKHFGRLQPKKLPELNFPQQPLITQPIVKEVVGLQAENISIGWRFGGMNTDDMPMLNMIRMILSNGRAGIIDQNLNRPLKVLGASAGARNMIDYSVFSLSARNQRNQTLDDVKDLLFEQLELLKKGEFPDWLMEAAINNLRLQEMRNIESYGSRAALLNMAFLNFRPYEDVIGYLDRLSAITKQDVIDFAKKHLRNDNYVVVYKRQGQPNIEAVDKPAITPIHINRDAESPLLTKIKGAEIEPVEPVFIDYEKDIIRGKTPSNIEVFYAHNQANPTFSTTYTWEKGRYHDKILAVAGDFISFVGTNRLTVEEIGNEFYKLACSFNVFVGEEQTAIAVSGLSENMVKAMKLLEEIILDAKPDEEALKRYVESLKKSRRDSKATQQANFSALVDYATFGKNNPTTYTLTDEELDGLTSYDLIKALQNLWGDQHYVVFFGPESLEDASKIIAQIHKTPSTLKSIERISMFEPQETTKNKVFFAHYDANQSYLQAIMKGKEYSNEMAPLVRLFNSYFGGGMNAIVFQEMREKRGLAYTARSNYIAPRWPDQNYINNSFIATQNDKVIDAFTAFNDLFDNMPISETSFNLAQEQLISNIRTQRIRNTQLISSYLTSLRMGQEADPRKTLFNELPTLSLDDVVGFNAKYIKNKPKTYVILGDEKVVDFEMVEKLFGPVTKLTKEDLFIF